MVRLCRGMAVFLGLALLAGVVRMWGQQTKGSFTGTVTDQSGAVVVGVKVTATEQGTGFTESSVTTGVGSYTLPLLPPGVYTITAV